MGIEKDFTSKELYKFLTFNSNEAFAFAANNFGSLFSVTVMGLNDKRNKNKIGSTL
ncbi:hypothetical protein FSS13T_03890 [Flavobacterium saliperosum S13]|uniref:Uncharacterized protein n=1 Tax=Flavobacterium saliperosum S13 TaxID=1341155 RepID=A0ABN0QJS6_9FLAO|nr:hypothetical protein FSS13T_03890 [Flavobacterium saliperosum S13]